MKKKITLAIFALCASLAVSTAEIKILDINTRKVSESSQNFDLNITFANEGESISDWAFGFYMLVTYNSLNHVNSDLKLEISNINSPELVKKLYFVTKNNTLIQEIYGIGVINIFAPESSDGEFPLKKGNTYKISLKNSNQDLPVNLTLMPQSFFIIKNYNKSAKTPDFITINSDANVYKIGGYDLDKIKGRIDNHIKDEWNSSQEIEKDNLADKYSLVPSPVSIKKMQGTFVFKNKQAIPIYNELSDDANVIEALKSYLKEDLSLETSEINTVPEGDSYGIIITQAENLDNIKNDPESYIISIGQKNIVIKAINSVGAFYAVQTLRQLWHKKNQLPCLRIVDYPRFKYRGILLDTSRHFFSVYEVKKLIDIMAAHKLNTLHMHLSDDEGWRIQLKDTSLVNLAKVGGIRGFAKSSQLAPTLLVQANLDITNHTNCNPDNPIITQEGYSSANALYEGYYKPEDIKDIIKYANDREITVIPEIDIPGHARAMIYSMPEAFIDPNDTSKYISNQGYTDDVISVYLYNSDSAQGKVFTETMNKIVTGLADLFKNQTTVYNINNEVSVGGDEVSSDAWSDDSSVKGVWKDKNALEKSHYFFKLLQKNNSGLIFSGWQQFVQNDDGTLNKTNAVPSGFTGHIWVWEPSEGAIKHAQILAKEGYSTVLAFADNTYFDLTYTPDMWEPGQNWAGSFLGTNAVLSVAKNTKKVLDGLSDEEKKQVIGVEGALWSELIPTLKHLMYISLPKMSGLAEAAWAPSNVTVKTTVTGDGKSIDALNWKSLAKRLGSGNNGFLYYLNNISGCEYRGFPYGISKEVPEGTSL